MYIVGGELSQDKERLRSSQVLSGEEKTPCLAISGQTCGQVNICNYTVLSTLSKMPLSCNRDFYSTIMGNSMEIIIKTPTTERCNYLFCIIWFDLKPIINAELSLLP